MNKIKDTIYWVGHIDWGLREFHGYSTPFGSTYNAYLILDKEKVPFKLCNLQNTHISDVVAGVMLSRILLVGRPMLNNKVLPPMAAFLNYLEGLKPKNRYAFTFGSYGWVRLALRNWRIY